MKSKSRVWALGLLLASTCASVVGAEDGATLSAGVEKPPARAPDASPVATNEASSAAIGANDRAHSCDGKLTELFDSKGPLTLQDIPDSAVMSEFRPDLYRTLAPMFEFSMLLPDGFLLPDGKALNEHVIFRAEGATVNLIVLFDGRLPCPRAGCTMLAYHEDQASKTLSRIYLTSKRATFVTWGPPRVVFGECGVESLYFVDALDNKEVWPDRFRSKLGDLETVFMLTAKPAEK
ncbi:MAG: hypothetical protein ACOZAA_04575 [Pseudomonadota bacterium]